MTVPVSPEIRRLADAMALLVKSPRTAPEVSALVGVHPRTVRAWYQALEDEGLARKAVPRLSGQAVTAVWEWAA